ncbi:MAG: type II toxin-antitoxin system RelE/ParE family toxin, partial [Bryobacterales bacterium]|nr:type II toxin-antitoxin system RelE/ParE family toxin [Bryobacterales bacterium]
MAGLLLSVASILVYVFPATMSMGKGLQKEVFSCSMGLWSFWDYHTALGENLILRWLNSSEVPRGAKVKINARIFALQGFPIFPEKFFSAYRGWSGLYELRIVFAGVQYRPFGFYGPQQRQFSLLIGGIEKGKVPKRILEAAHERRK